MRKLDDIIPPSRRREFEATGEMRPASSDLRMPTRGQTPSGFPYRTAIVAVLVTAGALGALFYFGGAKVVATPASAQVSVATSLTAELGQGDLPFEVIRVEKVASQSVTGSGTKTVSTPATGKVTVYNTQAKAQPLVANTRFATKDGLVFRIHTAITVPKGTEASPGSVTATLYADKPGDTYNVGPTSFTLPGLAGSPQFTQVYAVSSAPMTGGASGAVPVVATDVEAAARASLTAALAPDLMKALQEAVPEGYVLIPGAGTTTSIAESSAPSGTTGMVDIKQLGIASAVVFPERSLAEAVAKQGLGAVYTGEPVTFASLEGLRLDSAITPSSELKTYTFTLSGATTLVYVIDPSRIASAIAGKSRTSAEVVLTNFPEIKKARLILRPFWRQTFPQDPASITIETETP